MHFNSLFKCPFAKQAAGHSKSYVRSETKDKQCPSSLEFILLLHYLLQFGCCQFEAKSVVVHGWQGLGERIKIESMSAHLSGALLIGQMFFLYSSAEKSVNS